MSQETIDNRVVELKFDNEQFEDAVSTSQESLTNLNDTIDESCTQSADAISDLSDTMGESNKGIQGILEKVTSKFSTMGTIGTTVTGQLTTQVVNLAEQGLAKLFSGITKCTNALVEGGKTRATNLQKAKFQLAGLGIAWEEVGDTIDHAVSGTAFSLDEAALATGQLMASGVEAGDELNDVLETISGVAAVTDQSYDRVAQVFERVAGQGRMFATDLNSLSSMGLNVAAELAKKLGKTEAEVRDMVSDGKIGLDDLTDGLQKYFEVATAGNKTLSTATTNFYTQFKKVGEKFWTPLVANIDETYTAIDGKTKKTYFGLVNLFNSGIEGVNNFKSTIDNLAFAWTDLTDVILRTGDKGIKTIFGEYDDEGNKQPTEWMTNLSDGLTNLTNGVMKGLTGNGMQEAFESILDFMNRLSEAFKNFTERFDIEGMVSGAVKALESAIKIISKFGSSISKGIAEYFKKGAFDTLINNLKSTIDLIKTIASWLTPTEKGFKDLQTTMKGFVALLDILLAPIKIWKGVMQQLKGGMGTSEGLIADNLFAVTANLSEFAIQLDEVINDLIEKVIPKITEFVKQLKEKFTDASNNKDSVFGVLKEVASGLKGGSEDFAAGSEAIGNAWKKLIDGVEAMSNSEKIAAIISGAGVAVTALFTFYKKWQQFQITIKRFSWSVDDEGSMFGKKILGPFATVINMFSDLWKNAKSALNAFQRSMNAKAVLYYMAGMTAILAGLALFVGQVGKFITAISEAKKAGNMDAVWAAVGIVGGILAAMTALFAVVGHYATTFSNKGGILSMVSDIAEFIPFALMIATVAASIWVVMESVISLTKKVQQCDPEQLNYVIGILITVIGGLTLAVAACSGLAIALSNIPMAWAGVLGVIGILATVTLAFHVFINDLQEFIESLTDCTVKLIGAADEAEGTMEDFANNWSKIINGFNRVSWGKTINAFGKFGAAMTVFGLACGAAWTAGLNKGSKITAELTSILDNIDRITSMNVERLSKSIEGIGESLTVMSDVISGFGDHGEKKASKKFRSAMSNIYDGFNYISTLDSNAFTAVPDSVDAICDAIDDLMDADVDGMNETIADIGESLKSIGDIDVDKPTKNFKTALDNIKDGLSDTVALSGGAGTLKTIADAFDKFAGVDNPQLAADSMSEALEGIAEEVTNFTNDDFQSKASQFVSVLETIGGVLNIGGDVDMSGWKAFLDNNVEDSLYSLYLGVNHFSSDKVTDWAKNMKSALETIGEPLGEFAKEMKGKAKTLAALDDVNFNGMFLSLKSALNLVSNIGAGTKDQDAAIEDRIARFGTVCEGVAVALAWFDGTSIDTEALKTIGDGDTLYNAAKAMQRVSNIFGAMPDTVDSEWTTNGITIMQKCFESMGNGLKAFNNVDAEAVKAVQDIEFNKFSSNLVVAIKPFADNTEYARQAQNFCNTATAFAGGMSTISDAWDDKKVTSMLSDSTKNNGIVAFSTAIKNVLNGWSGSTDSAESGAAAFSDACMGIADGIANFVDEGVDGDVISGLVGNAGAGVAAFASSISEIVTRFSGDKEYKDAGNNFANACSGIAEGIGWFAGYTNLGETITSLIGTAGFGISAFASGISRICTMFSGDIDYATAADNFASACSSIATALSTFQNETGETVDVTVVSTGIKGIINALNSMVDWDPTDALATFSTVGDSLQKAFDKIAAVDAEAAGNSVANGVQSIINSIGKTSDISSACTNFSTSVVNAFTDIASGTNFKNIGTTIVKTIASGITSGASTGTKAASTVGTKIKNALSNKLTQAAGTTIGKHLMTGLQIGLINNASTVYATAGAIGDKVVSTLEEHTEVNSPSKATMRIGGFLDQGLVLGLKESSQAVYDEAGTVGDKTVEAMNSAIQNANTYIETEDLQPVITPQLNLDDVKKGMKTIDTYNKASSIAVQFEEKRKNTDTNDTAVNGGETTNNYYFNQTNNSSKALDTIEIYRQTKSIVGTMRGVTR